MPLDFVIDTLSHFVRRVDGPPPGIPAHVRPDFEQELTWLCEWHALTPIILDSLDRLALHPQISRIAFERIRALSSAERALSADLVATACSLSERFAARNVGCLLMDGVLLAPTLYAKRGLRPIQKIDLLIREGDWVVALECCREAGFELLPRSPRFDDGADALLYYQHYPACTLQNKAGDQLRLHMRILDIGSPEEVEPAWSRAVVETETGVGRISLEDQLIRTCIRYAMTDFVRLLDAVDIGLILSDRETQLDWGYIEDRLRTKSVYAAVLLTLESAVRWLKLNGRLIGLPPPGHLRRRWFHTVWHVDCESYAMRRAYRAHKLRFTMLEAGRPKDKARFVGALVSPKREWVAAFFDRPYHPWLRIRFLLLVIRGRVGLRPTGNP